MNTVPLQLLNFSHELVSRRLVNVKEVQLLLDFCELFEFVVDVQIAPLVSIEVLVNLVLKLLYFLVVGLHALLVVVQFFDQRHLGLLLLQHVHLPVH